jgi:hypothetical protein
MLLILLNGSYDAIPTLFIDAAIDGGRKEFRLLGRDDITNK